MKTKEKYLKLLFIFTLILIGIGILGLINASSIIGLERYHDFYYFVKKQLLQGILGGLILGFVVSKINYHFWKKTSLLLLIINIILVGLCFVSPFKSPVNSAYRWLKLGPISLQPSEFLKVTYILFFSSVLASSDLKLRKKIFSAPFITYLISLGLIVIILAKQPSTGTSLILGLSSLAMYFSAGLTWKQFLLIVLLGSLFLGFLIIKSPYRLERIMAYLEPTADPLGKGYQSIQSLIGIGSGGLFGVGIGKSVQKFNYLPESHTDAIFSILAEELGFVGSLFIISMFLLFITVGLGLAQETSDLYGRLIIIGIISGIGFQAFINIAAITKVFPLTGIPLPFISYGSSAFVTNLLGLGIITNIAKHE